MIDWDRTHDWEIQCIYWEQAQLTIRFRGAVPSIAEIVALRRNVSEFRHRPPAEIREMLGATGRFVLAEAAGRDARQLRTELERDGLTVQLENTSRTEYTLFDRTSNAIWRIEDPALAAETVAAMRAAGVPVVTIEA